jgi:hypothetical protein
MMTLPRFILISTGRLSAEVIVHDAFGLYTQ